MISVKNLRKRFGPIVAVDDISFEVSKGEVLGLLGPNGAGKSTTIRMITSFLQPDSGQASVCGHDTIRSSIAVRECLGYLAEDAPAYAEMTTSSFLHFICDARRIRGSQRQEAIDRVLRMCAIEPVYYQMIDTLSKGYQRRLGLAQALIHDPAVLILDEPTDGLDPNQKHEVRQLILKIAKEKCILISTHILEEVDAVCTRTIIIDQGKILVDSTPRELKEKYQCSLDEVFRKITKRKTA
ncbi:MAG: ABC transporter ATP-binding protein [Planctomycetes bacterium]|nr:ABC transporter ATP-binding protein [Planctomycetota bacterium]